MTKAKEAGLHSQLSSFTSIFELMISTVENLESRFLKMESHLGIKSNDDSGSLSTRGLSRLDMLEEKISNLAHNIQVLLDFLG